MLNDPDLVKKIDEAAGKATVPQQPGMMKNEDAVIMDDPKAEKAVRGNEKNNAAGNNSVLSQVVGVIIGSPEFQRK